ncbi:MAG: hypothetical protein V7775_10620 [Sulfitobacter sp.]
MFFDKLGNPLWMSCDDGIDHRIMLIGGITSFNNGINAIKYHRNTRMIVQQPVETRTQIYIPLHIARDCKKAVIRQRLGDHVTAGNGCTKLVLCVL